MFLIFEALLWTQYEDLHLYELKQENDLEIYLSVQNKQWTNRCLYRLWKIKLISLNKNTARMILKRIGLTKEYRLIIPIKIDFVLIFFSCCGKWNI